MARNLELKCAIIKSGRPAYEIAQQIGLDPCTLSKIVNGIVNATETVQIKLSIVLNTPQHELFRAQL